MENYVEKTNFIDISAVFLIVVLFLFEKKKRSFVHYFFFCIKSYHKIKSLYLILNFL